MLIVQFSLEHILFASYRVISLCTICYQRHNCLIDIARILEMGWMRKHDHGSLGDFLTCIMIEFYLKNLVPITSVNCFKVGSYVVGVPLS